MSILDRLKKTPAPAKGKKAAKLAPTKEGKTDAEPSKVEAPVEKTNTAGGVTKANAFTLLQPHVSEKAAHLSGRGIYVFDVPVTANKIEIRKAVESQYKVNVTAVRTIRGIGKVITRGKTSGKRNNWKKALVELKKGQTLNLVEGV
jgi:large subunit ribosomal protein L23